jgi:hypothetical protein
MKFKVDNDKLTIEKLALIYLPLFSSLLSNLIYGLIGGGENTFSHIVTILIFIYILIYPSKIKIDTFFLVLFLLITTLFLCKIFNLDYGNEKNATGLTHGFQICIKLFFITALYSAVKKLSSVEIKSIYKDFVRLLIIISIVSLPFFIFAVNELIQTRSRFIAMDDGDSYRYGGFGFETLDFAYCTIIALLIVLGDFNNSKIKKITIFLFLLAALYLTKSNFITITVVCISLFWVLSFAINGSLLKKMTCFIFILLTISILLSIETKILMSLLFPRFSELEEGTSLGERMLPGLNLLNHYFSSFGYLKLPAPGISVAEAINISENYISFNAWGLSKLLSDFGFLGIPAVFFLLFYSYKLLQNSYGNLFLNSIGIVSLAYIFAQAGYMNFTAVTFLMLSYQYNKISKINNI